MKIAYLILCHTDPQHIARLSKKLLNGTENEIFIHVDAKADIVAFKHELENVKRIHFLKKRTRVYWGGYSAVEATIELLRVALECGTFERFVLLQGLEYPIASNKYIDEFFQNHSKTEFMRAQNISIKKDWHEQHKYRLFYFLDNKNIFVKVLHKCNSILCQMKVIPHLKKSYAIDKNGAKLDIYQGCAQFGITRKAAEYIVSFHEGNPKFNLYFKSMYAVDESYFHTILYNSEYAKNTVDGMAVDRPHLTDFENLTYFEYPVQVTLFTQTSDWEKIKNSGFLYFRKASSESKELLDLIDLEHEREGEK